MVSVFVFRGAGAVMFGGTYLVFGAGAAVVSVFVFRGARTVVFRRTRRVVFAFTAAAVVFVLKQQGVRYLTMTIPLFAEIYV